MGRPRDCPTADFRSEPRMGVDTELCASTERLLRTRIAQTDLSRIFSRVKTFARLCLTLCLLTSGAGVLSVRAKTPAAEKNTGAEANPSSACAQAEPENRLPGRISLRAPDGQAEYCVALSPRWNGLRIGSPQIAPRILWEPRDLEAIGLQVPSGLVHVDFQIWNDPRGLSSPLPQWSKAHRVEMPSLELFGHQVYLDCRPALNTYAAKRGGELCTLSTEFAPGAVLKVNVATLVLGKTAPSDWPAATTENQTEWHGVLRGLEPLLGTLIQPVRQ